MNIDDLIPEALRGHNIGAYQSDHTICPVCCKNMVSITIDKEGHPQKDDVGMCLHCGGWFTVADDKGSLRWATEAEVDSVSPEQKELSYKSHFEITNKRN